MKRTKREVSQFVGAALLAVSFLLSPAHLWATQVGLVPCPVSKDYNSEADSDYPDKVNVKIASGRGMDALNDADCNYITGTLTIFHDMTILPDLVMVGGDLIIREARFAYSLDMESCRC